MSIEHEQDEYSLELLPERLLFGAAILEGVAAVTESSPLFGIAGACFLGAAALHRHNRKNSEG